jgi:hypothetical protein
VVPGMVIHSWEKFQSFFLGMPDEKKSKFQIEFMFVVTFKN